MQININGQNRTFTAPLNVTELLGQLQLAAERVVVELNREILTTDHHSTTLLQDGDQLELIQFVGGG